MKLAVIESASQIILPEQFWDEPRPSLAGEMGLLWAILCDGVRCYREAVLRGATFGADFREADDWIFGPQTPRVTSFETLCGVFSIDASRLRHDLLRFRLEVEERFGNDAAAC